MQIFIRTIEGVLLTLQVLPKTTIEQVMAMIQAKCEQERVKSRLSYASVTMLEQNTLEHYHVEANSTINENGRLRGGAVGNGSDAEMGNGEVYVNFVDITDKDLMQEVMKRGLMEKLLESWSPHLPNIPDISSKAVSWIILMCFFSVAQRFP